MTSKIEQYIISMPILMLIYGLFAVLCHMAFVFLYAEHLCSIELHIFDKLLFELLEYSAMSLLLIVLGSFISAMIIKKRER